MNLSLDSYKRKITVFIVFRGVLAQESDFSVPIFQVHVKINRIVDQKDKLEERGEFRPI